MRGQAKGCKFCEYKFVVGDGIIAHLIDNHLSEFLTYWFYNTLPFEKREEILEYMLEYDKEND